MLDVFNSVIQRMLHLLARTFSDRMLPDVIMACKVTLFSKPVFTLTLFKLLNKVKIYNIPCITHPTPIVSFHKRSYTKGNDQSHSVKEQIISKLNFENMEHAQPYYELPIKTLVHIYKITKNDEKQGYCKNRLYYLSDKLKCSPAVLSKHIVQRTFVYTLSFDWLQKSLTVLLDMGITSEGMLRDLWVLKYNSSTIYARLQKVKNMGVKNMHPWMVRCSEDILKRYIEIMQETKSILGETKSTQVYLAERLNTTIEAVNEMCLKTPALKTIRVTKVKNFLDYLLSEGFTVEDVANKPRILAASQKTIKHRIDKLRQLGVDKINLNILCRSKKHFKKFCDSFESIPNESNFDSKTNSTPVGRQKV